MATAVTVLPPQESKAQFDRHAFDGARVRAVSAKTRLSFQDYGSMHIQHRNPAVWRRKPEQIAWTRNNDRLREVITRYLENRNYVRTDSTKTYEDRLAAIQAAAAAWRPHYERRLNSLIERNLAGEASAVEVQNVDSRIVTEERGAHKLVTAVVYLSYRLGWNSRQVAQELGLKPPMVRIWLYRLNKVANDIETGRVRRHRVCRALLPEDIAKAFELRKSGKTWQRCAEAIGRNPTAVSIACIERYGLESCTVRVERSRTPTTKRIVSKFWTPARLRALWLLRANRTPWDTISTMLGRNEHTVIAAYHRYFPKAKAISQTGKRFNRLYKASDGRQHIQMGIRP